MRNLKRTRFFSLGRKWVFTLALFLLVFAAASVVKVEAVGNVTGWLWGGSEDGNIGGVVDSGVPDGNETGVGWISMSGTNYGVNIPDASCVGAAACAVTGYAWASASDIPNDPTTFKTDDDENGIGWIDFNPQNHCVPDTNGVLDDLSFSEKYEAKNCEVPVGSGCIKGVSRSVNDLTGCARIISIAQASVTENNGGWDGWIKMSGTAKDGNNYGVNINPETGEFCAPGASTTKEYDSPISGKYHCFAWSGEEPLTVTATQKNMATGLGGFDFAMAKAGPTPTSCSNVHTGGATLPDNTCTKVLVDVQNSTDGDTLQFNNSSSNSSKIEISSNSDCSSSGSPISCTLNSNQCSFFVRGLDFSVNDTVPVTIAGCGGGVAQINLVNSTPTSCTCGSADGKRYCNEGGLTSSDPDLCPSGVSAINFVENDRSYNWDCGDSSCPCSAAKTCGWIETNP